MFYVVWGFYWKYSRGLFSFFFFFFCGWWDSISLITIQYFFFFLKRKIEYEKVKLTNKKNILYINRKSLKKEKRLERSDPMTTLLRWKHFIVSSAIHTYSPLPFLRSLGALYIYQMLHLSFLTLTIQYTIFIGSN